MAWAKDVVPRWGKRPSFNGFEKSNLESRNKSQAPKSETTQRLASIYTPEGQRG